MENAVESSFKSISIDKNVENCVLKNIVKVFCKTILQT